MVTKDFLVAEWGFFNSIDISMGLVCRDKSITRTKITMSTSFWDLELNMQNTDDDDEYAKKQVVFWYFKEVPHWLK